jgi:hypothetical protein
MLVRIFTPFVEGVVDDSGVLVPYVQGVKIPIRSGPQYSGYKQHYQYTE